jgi:hypothetical protein
MIHGAPEIITLSTVFNFSSFFQIASLCKALKAHEIVKYDI